VWCSSLPKHPRDRSGLTLLLPLPTYYATPLLALQLQTQQPYYSAASSPADQAIYQGGQNHSANFYCHSANFYCHNSIKRSFCMTQIPTLLQTLASHVVQRAKTLGLRGKARDDMAVDFFCGAYATAIQIGHPAADSLGIFLSFSLAPRGFSEIEKQLRTTEPR
jgi:hypothetical protein